MIHFRQSRLPISEVSLASFACWNDSKLTCFLDLACLFFQWSRETYPFSKTGSQPMSTLNRANNFSRQALFTAASPVVSRIFSSLTGQRLQPLSQASLRLAASGVIALQTAVVGSAVSEFIATHPQLSNARVALAQGSKVQAAESAVVYIEAGRSRGSGVIIDPEGLIVTNAHVVEGADQIMVTIHGREMQAEVVSIGDSHCLDLALLQVRGARNLSAIPFADATDIYKTQTIYAVGYPSPLSGDSATITQGIVSNIHPNQGNDSA